MPEKSRGRGWGILWHSKNQLDGEIKTLLGCARYERAAPLSGYNTIVFRTRKEARAYLEQEYGYLKGRVDLRREPFGWKMPKVVPVKITVEEAR